MPATPDTAALDFARTVGRSIDASPSPPYVVDTVARRLEQAGFSQLDETAPWTGPVPERWYLTRGGAVIAGVEPPPADRGGFRIVGAHTDSPTLRLKPRPDTGRAGCRQLGVEVYGGALFNSWLDRDLGLSGTLAVSGDGGVEPVRVRIDDPVLRIPQLAVHLDGDIREKGLVLDPQRHLVPVWGLGESTDGALRDHLAGLAGVDPRTVLGWNLVLHDTAPATLAGGDDEFLVSARLDDLCSVFCAVEALLARVDEDATLEHSPVLCFFDHEEVGSVSATGAGGSMLPSVLERVAEASGRTADDHAARLARSLCISADMAHATHPNYADRHEPDHWVHLNEGPVIKVNANQRYATDAVGAAAAIDACRRAGVPHQTFVSRSDLPCGSTIGPVTAGRLGVPTVDVGIPQWAMHSCRETGGSSDPLLLRRMLSAFF